MPAPNSKHEPTEAPSLEEAFAGIIAPIQREREGLMLEMAQVEIQSARVLLKRARARMESVGVEVPTQTDGLLAADTLEVLAGSLGSEIGRRS